MKILWASPNTLLDSANGAGIMVRECLRQLALRNCDIRILGGTIFVSPEGMRERPDLWERLRSHKGRFIDVAAGNLRHRLLVTERPERRLMLSFEEQRWFEEYRRLLDTDKPDLVLFFDNSLITLLTADEARRRGIPVGVFLMHGNNHGSHWCRDVSWIFTDTQATARMYADREGYKIIPIGTFVDPQPILAPSHSRRNLLFVNPIPAKGGGLVVQTVLALAQRRPDICVEIVDTRGSWASLLDRVSAAAGKASMPMTNVTITGNTGDMRSVYGRARLLLVPSLWRDSGPRVIVEALLNGVPVIGSDSGGIPEVLGTGGEILPIPEEYRIAPYTKLFEQSFVDAFIERIVRYWDDESFYTEASGRASETHKREHDLTRNSDALKLLIERCVLTGDGKRFS